MKILILGVSGMLGSTVFRRLSRETDLSVWGTERGSLARRMLRGADASRIIGDVDIDDWERLTAVVEEIDPEVVINCVGVVKQLASAKDPLAIVPINTLLPHRLHRLCRTGGRRLVHISTDCVFLGTKGNYREGDIPDARDLYGLSKYLGEVGDAPAITLRTSIIGHELASNHSLLCWFLSQKERARGFSRAIFSGLPTVELADVIKDVVLPRPELCGLYHVAAEPINKFDLLRLIAREYAMDIIIERDESLVIDRSLDATQFAAVTGYVTPGWPDLIAKMHQFEEWSGRDV